MNAAPEGLKALRAGLPSGEVADPDAVRTHLARLLRSDTLANAPSLRRLLSYVVEETLEGRADVVKEYSIGVEVFERGESFDPRTDTIVRVQARRLRSKLREYYEAEGTADAIGIELPKGRYVPRFRWVQSGERSPPLPFGCAVDGAEDAIPVSSIPVPRTSLVGREADVATVRALLQSTDVRLVTLTGPGGSGKTRLALRVASDVSADFPGGVPFVGLGSVADFRDVGPKVAQALGLRCIAGGSLDDALREHVRRRVHERTLLVLDNFEQVLEAAPLLAALSESSAALTLLVTSRAVLRLSGEQVFHVPPLAVPDAVALFVQRAAAGRASFGLTAENAPAIAEVCARVDGLPLAIELAAARTRVLSAAQIRERLTSRLEVLVGGSSDLPHRQQTLRKTIEWSHDLLTPPEQRLLRRLAVFAGSWTIEGARAVCDAAQDLGLDTVEGLSSLVDQSLIQPAGEQDGELRFAMLETVREFALERLVECGERGATQRAHAAYCIVLAEEGLAGAGGAEWLARCDREHDDHRAALDHLIATGDSAWALRLARALFEYWDRREHRSEGLARLQAVLGLPGLRERTKDRAGAVAFASLLAPLPEAARLAEEALAIYREWGDLRGVVGQLNNLGVNYCFRGDHEGARHWLEQSLETCRKLGDRAAIASALSNLANVAGRRGRGAEARAQLVEALGLFREVGHLPGQAWSHNHLGDLARAYGNLAEARRQYQEGASLFRSLGDAMGLGRSVVDLGQVASEEGDLPGAHALFADALRTFVASGHKLGVAIALEAFAGAAAQQQQPGRALTLAGAASGVRRSVGSPGKTPLHTGRAPRPASAGGPDDVEARSRWTEGLAMSVEQAVEYALAGGSPPANEDH